MPGSTVLRVLPYARRRHVGPFVFLDHWGPVTVPAQPDFPEHPPTGGVGPHPHIGLATVTTLFAGATVHRDSLGTVQRIEPGAVNWMSAGRGIVHSERPPPALARVAHRSHGLQAWVALPADAQDGEPSFQHHPATTLPVVSIGGVRVHLLAGTGWGAASPVEVPSPLVYATAELGSGQGVPLPIEHAEVGVYVVEGSAQLIGPAHRVALPVHHLGIVDRADPPAEAAWRVVATEGSRIAVLGGSPLDGPRQMWWNFVHSDRAVIERAAAAWKARDTSLFPALPGDAHERIEAPPFLR